MKKIFNKTKVLLTISLLVSLFSIFLQGLILVNTQDLTPIMNTYSGGFPVAWFEFYYPKDVGFSFQYMYNNFDYYKVDLLAFFLNTVVIYLIISRLVKLAISLKKD